MDRVYFIQNSTTAGVTFLSPNFNRIPLVCMYKYFLKETIYEATKLAVVNCLIFNLSG